MQVLASIAVMADDLATLREELIAGAIAKARAGIKSYTIGGRQIVYATPQEMVDAILRLASATPSQVTAVTFAEVDG